MTEKEYCCKNMQDILDGNQKTIYRNYAGYWTIKTEYRYPTQGNKYSVRQMKYCPFCGYPLTNKENTNA